MLSTKYSLSGKKNYDRVQEMGKIYQSESFGISVFKREDNNIPRFGFIVSNKISSDAVQRNRIKRGLKAAVKYSLTDMKIGVDVVFLAKLSSARKSTDSLIIEAKEALKRVGLIK